MPLMVALLESGLSVADVAEKWEVVPRSITFFLARHGGPSPRALLRKWRYGVMVSGLLNKEPPRDTAVKTGVSFNQFLALRQQYRRADVAEGALTMYSLAVLMANSEHNPRSHIMCSLT
jgi:transposase-like protein